MEIIKTEKKGKIFLKVFLRIKKLKINENH
jgi:hypothetical protein